jgi:hypothetical protein
MAATRAALRAARLACTRAPPSPVRKAAKSPGRPWTASATPHAARVLTRARDTQALAAAACAASRGVSSASMNVRADADGLAFPARSRRAVAASVRATARELTRNGLQKAVELDMPLGDLANRLSAPFAEMLDGMSAAKRGEVRPPRCATASLRACGLPARGGAGCTGAQRTALAPAEVGS